MSGESNTDISNNIFPVINRLDLLNKHVLLRASTATYFNAASMLVTASVDGGRITYDPVTGKYRGLRVEGADTNVQIYSEDVSQSSWGDNNCTRVADTGVVSPIEGVNYGGIIADSNSTYHTLITSQLMSAGKKWSYSFFIKAGTFSHISLRIQTWNSSWSSTGFAKVHLNLNNGVVDLSDDYLGITLDDYSVINLGDGNYWVSITADIAGGTDVYYNKALYYITDSNYNTTTTGDGATISMYTTGGQLEEGYPSSYIATSGSSKTRSADLPTADLTSFWKKGCSVCFEVERGASDGENHTIFEARNAAGDMSERLSLNLNSDGTTLDYEVLSGASSANVNGGSFIAKQINKVAITFAENNCSLFVNGELVGTDTSCSAIPNLVNGYIGKPSWSGYWWNGYIKDISYFSSILTNDELRRITTC